MLLFFQVAALSETIATQLNSDALDCVPFSGPSDRALEQRPQHHMERNLLEYYRLPGDSGLVMQAETSGEPGFFQFGAATPCYGQWAAGKTSASTKGIRDALQDVSFRASTVLLPIDSTRVINDLRREHYAKALSNGRNQIAHHQIVRKLYYAVLRGLLPIPIRRSIQRIYFGNWQELSFPSWPVDTTVDTLHEELLKLSMRAQGLQRMPFVWFWPDGAHSCLVITHDVETSIGRDCTSKLMDLDESYGVKASFQVVPEQRYEVTEEFVNEIRRRGFELNIHDLSHDGSLFRDREEFLRRAAKINEYTRRYQTRGFRSGAMYRNQDWYDAFEFSYDMSVPCVGHLEPQRGGCCTVMPYFIGNILEIPLTAVQDYSLFHILKQYSIALWKEQYAIIKGKHGLMSFIIHPDYIFERRALKVYEALLDFLRLLIAKENAWMALPGDVDQWWRARNQLRLVGQGNGWLIEGPGKERARLAYAHLDGDRIVYEIT
jgi:hypothetical protein